MGLIDTIKDLVGKLRGDSAGDRAADAAALESSGGITSTADTGEEEMPKIDPSSLRQASYFKIHKGGRHFVRVYAPCRKILDHEIYLYIDGDIRVISSQYFIPEHLVATPTGDIVFMFVYKKELYPLPRGRAYFDRNFDLQVRYPPNKAEVSKTVADHPATQAAMMALNSARDAFLKARDAVRNFAAGQAQFFQKLSPLVTSGDTAVNAITASGKTPPEPEDATLVKILPAEPQAVLNIKKQGRSKKKQWQAAMDHLLRPD